MGIEEIIITITNGGAIVTAVATATGTTATISATNASMNADGNLVGSLDDVGKTTLKDTTSKEAVKNYAIVAVVAVVSAWAVQTSGGTATMEKGGDAVYKPDPKLMASDSKYRAFVETNYPNYNGVIDPSANNIGLANGAPTVDKIGQPINYSTNPFTSSFWQGFGKEGGFISDIANNIGGINGMSTVHDPWGQNAIVGKFPILQISIIPAITVEYCALSPAACAAVTSSLMNNDFGTKK